jgi:hypothetical protein
MKKNNDKNGLTSIEVIENPIVIYKDGKKELFNAIYITDGNIIIGNIVNDGDNEVFVRTGGIPIQNISKIEAKTKKKTFTAQFLKLLCL